MEYFHILPEMLFLPPSITPPSLPPCLLHSGSNPRSHITLVIVTPVSFNLGQFLNLFLIFHMLTFLKSTGSLFVESLQFGFVRRSLMISFRLCLVGRMSMQTMLRPSQQIISEGPQLLVMLAFDHSGGVHQISPLRD